MAKDEQGICTIKAELDRQQVPPQCESSGRFLVCSHLQQGHLP